MMEATCTTACYFSRRKESGKTKEKNFIKNVMVMVRKVDEK
jgi:hypothetical protein